MSFNKFSTAAPSKSADSESAKPKEAPAIVLPGPAETKPATDAAAKADPAPKT